MGLYCKSQTGEKTSGRCNLVPSLHSCNWQLIRPPTYSQYIPLFSVINAFTVSQTVYTQVNKHVHAQMQTLQTLEDTLQVAKRAQHTAV